MTAPPLAPGDLVEHVHFFNVGIVRRVYDNGTSLDVEWKPGGCVIPSSACGVEGVRRIGGARVAALEPDEVSCPPLLVEGHCHTCGALDGADHNPKCPKGEVKR